MKWFKREDNISQPSQTTTEPPAKKRRKPQSEARSYRFVVCAREIEGEALEKLAALRGVPPARAAWELIRDGLIREGLLPGTRSKER